MVIKEHDHGCNMEWGCKACSCQAGHVTSSTPTLKAVVSTTPLSHGEFDQDTLLDQLTDVEARSKSLDDAMVINEPVKPVAGSSKHPNDMDIIDGELIY